MTIPAFMQDVDWQETGAVYEGELPYATHAGVMELMGHKLRCYRLNDGRAIFDADDLNAFMSDFLGGESA